MIKISGSVIFIALFLILLAKMFSNKKQSIILYIIFSLISPNLLVFDLQISFEIFAFFFVTPILLIKRKAIFNVYRNWLYRQCLWCYFFLFIISSLIGGLIYNGTLSWIPIFAIFRVICVIYMLQYIFKDAAENALDSIMWPVLFINLLVSTVQLTVPESIPIFYDFYYKTSLTPLEVILALGYFDRGYGTFGTPVLLGAFNLFCFAIYFGFYLEKKSCKFLKTKIMMSLICGLLSFSKTFILGVPVLLIISSLVMIFGFAKSEFSKTGHKVLLLFMMAVAIFIVLTQFLDIYGNVSFQNIEYIFHPLDALETRYSQNTGILSETYSIINENLIIGIGATAIDEVFIGDSMYITMLYSTGVIGVILYFSTLGMATFENKTKGNVTAFLCFFVICLAGVAAPVQFQILSAILIEYIFHKAKENTKNMQIINYSKFD